MYTAYLNFQTRRHLGSSWADLSRYHGAHLSLAPSSAPFTRPPWQESPLLHWLWRGIPKSVPCLLIQELDSCGIDRWTYVRVTSSNGSLRAKNGENDVDAITYNTVQYDRKQKHCMDKQLSSLPAIDDDIVRRPVGASGQCVGMHTSRKWIDFGRI